MRGLLAEAVAVTVVVIPCDPGVTKMILHALTRNIFKVSDIEEWLTRVIRWSM